MNILRKFSTKKFSDNVNKTFRQRQVFFERFVLADVFSSNSQGFWGTSKYGILKPVSTLIFYLIFVGVVNEIFRIQLRTLLGCFKNLATLLQKVVKFSVT